MATPRRGKIHENRKADGDAIYAGGQAHGSSVMSLLLWALFLMMANAIAAEAMARRRLSSFRQRLPVWPAAGDLL